MKTIKIFQASSWEIQHPHPHIYASFKDGESSELEQWGSLPPSQYCSLTEGGRSQHPTCVFLHPSLQVHGASLESSQTEAAKRGEARPMQRADVMTLHKGNGEEKLSLVKWF